MRRYTVRSNQKVQSTRNIRLDQNIRSDRMEYKNTKWSQNITERN